jgi:hypothetical protein
VSKETDQPKTGAKVSRLTPEERRIVVEVLKAGMLYPRMLDGFETAFINETVTRYAKYGLDMMVVGHQLSQFRKLARKLNVA